MSNLPDRRSGGRSIASIADDALLVGVVVIGALVLLKVVGVIASTLWFLAKLAIAAAVVYALVRAVRSRAR